MAQTRKRRRRKHRGTQAGTIETPAHRSTAKPTAKTSTSGTRERRPLRQPTWRTAAYKAAAAAVVFLLLSLTIFHNKAGASVITVVIVFLFYWPIAYTMDRATYRRRLKMQARKGQ